MTVIGPGPPGGEMFKAIVWIIVIGAIGMAVICFGCAATHVQLPPRWVFLVIGLTVSTAGMVGYASADD